MPNQITPSDMYARGSKKKIFKLTFYELITFLCTAAVPIAICIYTAIDSRQKSKDADEKRQFEGRQADKLRQQHIYAQFIGDMYILDKDGQLNESAKPWAFANARYWTANRQWNPELKVDALVFLKRKNLIGRQCRINDIETKKIEDIIQLNELNFEHIYLRSQTNGLRPLNMECVHFDQISLSGSSFHFVNLDGATFEGSRLDDTTFDDSSLIGVTFKDSSLVGAVFDGTDLRGTNFGTSNLQGAEFINVDLTATKLTEKQLQQVVFTNSKLPNGTESKRTTRRKSKTLSTTTEKKNPVTTDAMGQSSTEKSMTTSTAQIAASLVFKPNISLCAKWNATGITIAGNANTEQGSNLSSLDLPCGIFVDVRNNNTLYVADQGNKRIMKFEKGQTSGEIVAKKDLLDPHGIYVDQHKQLYVGDSGKVLRFGPSETAGHIIAGGNGVGSEKNQLGNTLAALVVDDNENIYISDTENDRIVMWEGENSTTGSLVAENLDDPWGLYLDHLQNALYVADKLNHRIQQFNLTGNKAGETVAGGNGTGDSLSYLKNPTGITLDSNDNIYISEKHNYRVVRWLKDNYKANGYCIVGCSGNYGPESNQLWEPIDLKFDSDGNLIVSDSKNHRIQKFELIRNDCN